MLTNLQKTQLSEPPLPQSPEKASPTKVLRLNKFPLRTVLIIPFIIPILASTGLVGWLSFRNAQKAIDDLAKQLNSEISSRIEQQVLAYLNKPYDVLQTTYAGVQSGNLNLDEFDGLRRYFWQVVQSELANYPSFGNEQGEFVGVERLENGTFQLKIRTNATAPERETYELDDEGNPKKFLKSSKYDPRERPWYKAAKQAGKSSSSPIFPAFSRQNTSLEVASVKPIYDSKGQLLGVLCMNITLVRITQFIEKLYISPNGQSFIIERSGDLVASSTIPQPFKVIGQENDRKIERIPADKSSNATLKATAQHLLERFGNFKAINGSKQLKAQINGAWHYIQVLPIQDGRGIDWLAVVVVPENDFMARINANTHTTILLCLLTFAGGTVIIILTASSVTRPILKLTKASKEIAAGNLDKRVDITNFIEIKEIDTLENSFNSMAWQLKESFETLEDKVKERTAELASANDEIITLNKRLKEDNLRMGAELDIVRQMQQMILPNASELEIEGLDIAAYMEAADEVGGDYYDVLNTDGVVTLGIGDVTGHGLESGILMLMAQTAVRTLNEIRELDPVLFLDVINRTLYKNVQRMNSEKSLTLAILNYSEGQVSISGQHEETIIVRNGGQVERIDTMDLGFPIALDDDIAEFISHISMELHPGDGIVLYTDGIPEAKDINKKQYGVEAMCEVISQNWHLSAEEIKQAVIDDLRRYIGTQKVFDDITLLVVKRTKLGVEEKLQAQAATLV
ncbi:SpoIIE family protein phosphatase [Microcoleus sp. Pol11C3]|uniref:SpoIIE family protein phosphatase n=1 Tax=Microcoleus sp. Pol11C3 TaxID=3055390 RepID=UPI002FD52355